MSPNETNNFSTSQIDASCRVPLLALFGGAALWLVVGLSLSLAAIMTFHKPDLFADCAWLTYGRVQPAANDALLYGFCIPAALGVVLWIFARLSETELLLSLVPVAAANIWNLGVLIGVIAILIGDSTGFAWLEFPRGSSVLLFAAFLLIATSAVATFGQRKERELHPAHWFLLAALLWFPWIYVTANVFLVSHHPVRGVAQAVIGWWFANNLVFVWLALVGVGAALYFLPKFAGRPLQGRYMSLFMFCTLMLFGAWCGMPQGAPVPAWVPALSSVASLLLVVPLIAIVVVVAKIVRGSSQTEKQAKGGPLDYMRFGMTAFILSGLMLMASACPQFSRVTELTWFGPAQTQMQILGFSTMLICGAIYELLPGVMNFELPYPKFIRLQHWLFGLGIVVWVGSLAVGGVQQGIKLNNSSVAFADTTATALIFLRSGTLGLLLLLVGSLLFAANIFVMTLRWKLSLLKTLVAAVTAPLETTSDSVSPRRDRVVAKGEGGEVKS